VYALGFESNFDLCGIGYFVDLMVLRPCAYWSMNACILALSARTVSLGTVKPPAAVVRIVHARSLSASLA
jgi:hypothetical protein